MNRREFLAAGAAALASAQKSPSLAFASALAAAAAIRKRTISSVELTRMCFERIDRYNPKLNAIIFRMEAEALKRAGEADAALAKGENWGPFHGVPISIKESFAARDRHCHRSRPPRSLRRHRCRENECASDAERLAELQSQLRHD